MKVIDQLQRLEQMDQLIRLQATGNPDAFARRLGLSKSMLYNYIDLIRLLGGPVRYNKTSASFEYEYPVELKLGYKKK